MEIALIVVGGIFVTGGSFVTASYLWSEVSSQVDAARIQSDAVNYRSSAAKLEGEAIGLGFRMMFHRASSFHGPMMLGFGFLMIASGGLLHQLRQIELALSRA